MCLGVPGRLVAIAPDGIAATVDIGGAEEQVSLALLVDEMPAPGEWVAVHMGFAMARMTESEAHDALEALVTIGPGADAFDAAALYAEWGLAEQGGAA